MSAALKTALREACAEIRRKNSALDWTRLGRIEAWERLADEAELLDVAQEPMIERTDEELAAMLGVPVAIVAPESDRDISPPNVMRTAADIRAEMYGMPPSSGPGLKHGPGGTGRPGPCDADCRKCALEAEIASLRVVQEQHEPAGGAGGAAATSGPMPRRAETWDEYLSRLDAWQDRKRAIDQTGSPAPREMRIGLDRLQASLVAPVSLRLFADESTNGIPALEQLQRIIRAQYEPPAVSPPGHAMLCCARLGSVWCTDLAGHAGACKGPEERALPSNDFGKGNGRKR